ncbi:MAG: hypothetical protein R3C20_21430 [Planctomycetaceae bacterium]
MNCSKPRNSDFDFGYRAVLVCLCLILAPGIGCDSESFAQEKNWGSLRGQFIFSGEIPEADLLEITRDEEVCGAVGLKDESLVVHPESRGIRNVVIWLDTKTAPPAHPSLDVSDVLPRMDNKDCRFVPRILPSRAGQPVEFTNSDPVAHNAAVYARRNQPFSEVIPMNSPLQKTFPRAETQPIRVDCSIHSWMRGYLVITDHPYVAVSDENGEFELSSLPTGEWTFRVWHERATSLKTLETPTGHLALEKSQLKIEVAAEQKDLGRLTIKADQFRRN